MSDQAKLKEQLKKTVRSVVISAPLPLTPEQVEHDYATNVGHGIPYRQLGYNTCKDFLLDIPDTVKPKWDRGYLVVTAVINESTRHIQNLVSKQNVNVAKCMKKRHAMTRARPPIAARRGPSSDSWRPGSSAGQTRWASRSTGPNTGPRLRGPPAVPPSVPAYVRHQIKTFLINHPNGVLSSHFDDLFMEKFGHTICYSKLGFESLVHICRALSDSVRIERINGEEFRIYEKSNLPSHASVTPHPEHRPSSSSEKPAQSLQRGQEDNSRQRSSSSFNNATDHIRPQTQSSKPDDHVQNLASRPKIWNKPPQTSDTQPRPTATTLQSTVSIHDDVSATANSLTSDVFETKFLEEIQQILAQHPEGLWAAYLPDAYKKQFKQALPMVSLGYFSVTELMAAMPEVVAIERERKQGDWKLYDVRTYKPNTQHSPAKARSTVPTRSSDVEDVEDRSQGFLDLKKKMQQLLEGHPEGLLMKNLPLYFQRAYCEKFPLEELGFRDIESLIMMMPDTANVVYKGYGRLLVVPVKESSVSPRGLKSIPDDAVGWGFSYNYCAFPPLREYIEVYVATVFTPHRLCIQLKDKQRNDILDALMDDLEALYAYPEGNKYMFPESMIAVGQVCCALYLSDNNWHRGLITGIPNADFVEVLYVDYGTVANVSLSALRLLKSTFLRLPIQAYNARLAFIEPVEDKWTKESRDRLLALTAGKPLIALITDIERDELHLLLSDTTTTEDIHINDALVDAGLARFSSIQEEQQSFDPQAQSEQESEDGLPDSMLDLMMLRDVDVKETRSDEEDEAVEASTNRETAPEAIQNELTTATAASEGDSRTGPPPLLEACSSPSSSPDSQESKSSDLPQLEATTDEDQWIVKCIDFDDGNQVYLINYENEVCLSTDDVALLLCNDDSEAEEFLAEQIHALGIDIPLLTATSQEHPRLFRELRRIELVYEDIQEFCMFPFTSALLLLSSCPTVSMDMVQNLQETAEKLGVFGDMMGSDVSDTAAEELEALLGLEELNMALEALSYKRKRILSAMMQNTEVNYVDELSYIEQKIQEFSEKLEQAKSSPQSKEAIGDSMASEADEKGDRVPDLEACRNVDGQQNVTQNQAGNLGSPGRLVQAVEPRPRDDDSTPMSPQQEETLRTHQQQTQEYMPRQTQPPVGQPQEHNQPPTNQGGSFTPSCQNHYPNSPSPQFLNPQAPQFFLAQPQVQFARLNAQFPFMAAAGTQRFPQQHLGSGDFIPLSQQPMNIPNWLPAPPQGPFITQFAPHVPLAPLTRGVSGHPTRPYMMAPQGNPRMQGGQGSWW